MKTFLQADESMMFLTFNSQTVRNKNTPMKTSEPPINLKKNTSIEVFKYLQIGLQMHLTNYVQ